MAKDDTSPISDTELIDTALHPSKASTTLDTVSDNPTTRRETIHATQYAVIDGIINMLRECGATSRVIEWILLTDPPVAAKYLQYLGISSPVIRSLVARRVQAYLRTASEISLGDIYMQNLPHALRADMGEFFTPTRIVFRVIDELPHKGVVVDPACGDGRLIVELLRRGRTLSDVAAIDLNPVAVCLTRANVWLATRDPNIAERASIHWGDFATTNGLGQHLYWPSTWMKPVPQHSHIACNPPWILMKNLAPGYAAIAQAHFKNIYGPRTDSAVDILVAEIFVALSICALDEGAHLSLVLPQSVLTTMTTAPRRLAGLTSLRTQACSAIEPFPAARQPTFILSGARWAPHH